MNRLPRTGVYVCHCGTNIAALVNVAAVSEFAARLPGVAVVRDYLYMCSDPGQALIEDDIRRLGLQRVVVAACSPRMHEATFREVASRSGLNGYLTVMANIREQCAWVHSDSHKATLKARRLVASAVSRSRYLSALKPEPVAVEGAVAIIGGGIAGIAAALQIAEAGFAVHVVERSAQLGGHAMDLAASPPDFDPVAPRIDALVGRLQSHDSATIHLCSEVLTVEGHVGNFSLAIRECRSARRTTTIGVGSIIVATGFMPFDPSRKPELGLSTVPNVITSVELEHRLRKGHIGAGADRFRNVVFVQCVGSRDVQVGNEYCSRSCCVVAAKQARQLRRLLPQAAVSVLHMDVRAFGKGAEEFYDRARIEGVLFRRGSVSEVWRSGARAILGWEDTLLGRRVELEADLVVLGVGMEPDSGSARLSALLKLPRSADGFFLEQHPKLKPVETSVEGVFLAGCCQGPKDLVDTVAHARAAAASALVALMRGSVVPHAATATVDAALCSGCGSCVETCPSGAVALGTVSSVARVRAVLCQGCGACAVACPSGAVSLLGGPTRQTLDEVDALVCG